MNITNNVLKKNLTTRFSYNWLWLLYFWNLTSSLYDFQLSSSWYFLNKLKHKKLVNKPKFNFETFENTGVVDYDNKTTLRVSSDTINMNVFFTFMSLSMSPYSKYSRPHTFFTLLFMDHNRCGSFTLNLKRCYMRWCGTYSLLYNLFYYNHDVIIFGHKVFRVDILAINAVSCKKLNTSFKYATMFSQFRDSIYGSNIVELVGAVDTFDIETAFISDTTTLEKLATNLQVCDVYTIGLVSFADNPWIVSYPVPCHSNSLFTQYYFLRQLYHIQQNSAYTRFLHLAKVWAQF